MPSFYVAPYYIQDRRRLGGELARVAPLFFDADYNPTGVLTGRRSMMDFGGKINYGLLTTEDPIPAPLLTSEFFPFPNDLFKAPETKERDDVAGYLSSIGIDGTWIKGGESLREILHRLLGMCQSMQSGEDDPRTVPEKQDPSRWLAKPVRCGFVEVAAYDQRGFQAAEFERQTFLQKQKEKFYQKLYPYPVSWERGAPHWVMPDGRLLPVIMGGGTLGTDTFTTGSDAAISTYDANWVINLGGFSVVAATDDFYSNTSGGNGAYRSDISAPNDQYAQVVMSAVGFSGNCGPAVRAGGSGVATHYLLHERDNNSNHGKRVTGSFTSFFSDGGGAVADVMYIEAQGTTIIAKRNGTTLATTTDSSISSGSVGVCGLNSDSANRGDDWEGGDFAAAAASLLANNRLDRFQTMLVR